MQILIHGVGVWGVSDIGSWVFGVYLLCACLAALPVARQHCKWFEGGIFIACEKPVSILDELPSVDAVGEVEWICVYDYTQTVPYGPKKQVSPTSLPLL